MIITKIQNLFNFILARIILLFAHKGKREIHRNTLLITRLDSIGDYILFRNFLSVLKQSNKYKDYLITLCGNKSWEDLAESFDSDVVHDFIWINRKKFYSNIVYKYNILKNIYKCGFDVAIDSAYSREILFGDIIIKASKANIKIGSKGSLDKHAYWKRRFFSDSFYDIIIDQTRDTLFEFVRNKDFFERIIEENISILKPELNVSDFNYNQNLPENYVVLFPGSNDIKRRWDVSNYADICRYLIDKYSFFVVIPISWNEKFIAETIKDKVNSNKVIDLSGKASLSELAKIIADCELVISNDTSAVHIAAAVDKKFICISSGLYFGRFSPYPKSVFPKGEYVLPAEFEKMPENGSLHKDKNSNIIKFNINNVSVEQVKERIDSIMIKNK